MSRIVHSQVVYRVPYCTDRRITSRIRRVTCAYRAARLISLNPRNNEAAIADTSYVVAVAEILAATAVAEVVAV